MGIARKIKDLKWIALNPDCGAVWERSLEMSDKGLLVSFLKDNSLQVPDIADGERLILHYVAGEDIVDVVFTDKTSDDEEDYYNLQPNNEEIVNAIINDYSYTRLFNKG